MSWSKTFTVTHDSDWTLRGQIDIALTIPSPEISPAITRQILVAREAAHLLAKVLAVPAQHIISVSVSGHVQENHPGSNPDGLSIQVQVIQHHETKA